MTVTESIAPSFPQVGGMSQTARKTKQQAGTCKDYTLIMWKLDTAAGATAACSVTASTVCCTGCVRVCVCAGILPVVCVCPLYLLAYKTTQTRAATTMALRLDCCLVSWQAFTHTCASFKFDFLENIK